METAIESAKSAAKAKSEFLSRMSHDIRTPMNAIIGLTHLAQKEDDIETVRNYLAKISASSKFLLGLINDILDMSKIENGNLTLNPEPLTKKRICNFNKYCNTSAYESAEYTLYMSDGRRS